MRAEPRTPIPALARGLLAGLAGTAAMTAYQTLLSSLRSSGSENGESGSISGEAAWKHAPAPAKVGRRILEGLFKRDVPKDEIGSLSALVHWSYGTAWGAGYGVLKESHVGRSIPLGLAFGAGVWAASYVVLPAMKLYEPPWEYGAKTLATDLSYHLVYGLGVAGAYRALDELA